MSTTTATPKDSGLAFKLLVRVCGVGAIGALFLPFFQNEDGGISAFESFKRLLSLFQGEGFDKIIETLNFASNTDSQGLGLLLGGFIMVIVPVIFALVGLYMFLTAKYAGGPITLSILIILGGWLGFMFGGEQIGFDKGFFELLTYGFWVGVGAFALPFVGMFFLDKSI